MLYIAKQDIHVQICGQQNFGEKLLAMREIASRQPSNFPRILLLCDCFPHYFELVLFLLSAMSKSRQKPDGRIFLSTKQTKSLLLENFWKSSPAVVVTVCSRRCFICASQCNEEVKLERFPYSWSWNSSRVSHEVDESSSILAYAHWGALLVSLVVGLITSPIESPGFLIVLTERPRWLGQLPRIAKLPFTKTHYYKTWSEFEGQSSKAFHFSFSRANQWPKAVTFWM
jgi:hypothetical protein